MGNRKRAIPMVLLFIFTMVCSSGICAGSFGAVTVKAAEPVSMVSVDGDLPTGDLLEKPVPYTPEAKEAAEEVSISEIADEPAEPETVLINDGVSGDYGYDKLSSAQQTMYGELDAAFQSYISSDTYKTTDYNSSTSGYDSTNKLYSAFSLTKSFGDYGLSVSDGMKVYFCYRHNHPEYYWVSTTYYNYSNTSSKFAVLIANYYAEKASLRSAADSAIEAAVLKYQTAAAGSSDSYGKVKIVHDKLVDSVEYAYKTSGNKNSGACSEIWAHCAAGAFTNRPGKSDPEVVCEGYAKAFQLLLNELNIPNVYIVGTSTSGGAGGGGGHAWNAVKIDDTYHYIDTTWDDAGSDTNDGRSYEYMCMPKSKFEKSHTAYSSTSSDAKTWLYALPTMDNTMDYTYYKKYQSFFETVTSDNVMGLLNAAAAVVIPSSADTRYFHIMCTTKDGANLVANKVGANVYYPSTAYGYYRVVAPEGSFGITKKADSLALDKTEASIDCSKETLSLTATIAPSESDDVVAWSATQAPGKVSLSSSTGKTITATFYKAGSYVITARTVGGGQSEVCNVTVTGSNTDPSEHIFTDAACAKAATEDDALLYANGGKKRDAVTGNTVNYQSFTFYTNLEVPTYTDTKGKTKKGSLLVGVTSSATQPTLSKGKLPTDNTAKNIASASYKKTDHSITIKAKKNAGLVYLWVIQVANNKPLESGFVPVTVLQAPSKIEVVDRACTDSRACVYKKDTLGLGKSLDLYLRPTVKVNKTNTIVEDCSYSLSTASGMSDYVQIEPLSDYGYRVTALGLKQNKKTKVKLEAACDQGSKKASFTLTIENPVGGKATLSSQDTNAEVGVAAMAEGLAGKYMSYPVTVKAPTDKEAVEAKIDLSVSPASSEYSLTDSPKVYGITTASAFSFDNKGKLKMTKTTGDQAKLKGTLKNGVLTIKAPKKLSASTTTCILVVYNTNRAEAGEMNYGFFVVPVSLKE